jgi:hypothetical protein
MVRSQNMDFQENNLEMETMFRGASVKLLAKESGGTVYIRSTTRAVSQVRTVAL